jgi:hypothetical protein
VGIFHILKHIDSGNFKSKLHFLPPAKPIGVPYQFTSTKNRQGSTLSVLAFLFPDMEFAVFL